MKNKREKSDPSIVAQMSANKPGQPGAESAEPREGTEGNAGEQHTCRTQSRESVSQGLERVREVAKQDKKERFTSLLHHMTIDLLKDAYSWLKREAAPGVDGRTWQSYKENLEVNLRELHGRIHQGTYQALPSRRQRMEKFALSLHPDKTRLLEFGRYAAERRARRGLDKPETFNFLGFTHICGRSRRGVFQLKRQTRRDRMRARLRAIKEELQRRMHEPISLQGKWLRQVLRGYFAYHAVPTNCKSMSSFRHYVTDLWRRALQRRSQRDGSTWKRMAQLAAEFLPLPHILHPWPSERFAVRYPRWEPGA